MKANEDGPRTLWMRREALVLVSAVLGLLAGANYATLLFFLNPDLPFSAASFLRAFVLYAGPLAIASILLHLPWILFRPRRAPRVFPWSLLLVLGGSALLDAYQASHFAFFLPGGINRRLIKAAIWLACAALGVFYTALLHSLRGRRYGRKSQTLLWVLALGSLYTHLERREAFHRPVEVTPLPSRADQASNLRLLVVGIDTASLDVVLPLAQKGDLPFLATALKEGSYARLSSLTPNRPEALWTSVATGKYPYQHGILAREAHDAGAMVPGGVLRLLPAGLPVGIGLPLWHRSIPTTGRLRRSLSLWEILPRVGISAGVVGWPMSFPVGEELAFGLSDRFFLEYSSPEDVHPPELAARARLFRMGEGEAAFGGAELQLREELRVYHEALSQDSWRFSLLSTLLEERPDVRAVFVHLPGLAQLSNAAFGGFVAKELEGASGAASAAASRDLVAYYRLLDRLLSRLWTAAPEGDRAMVLVSAYGSAPVKRWLRPSVAGSSRKSPDGLFLIRGRGARPGAFGASVSLVDIAPTLLYLAGLPVARDLDGRVVTELLAPEFLARQPLSLIPSYEFLATVERASRGD